MTARGTSPRSPNRTAKPAPSKPAPLRSHKDLEAYQRSMELLVHVHELCETFPTDPRRDLANRMRRASETIPNSIAEGFGRKVSEKEFKKYIKTALASASEMRMHLRVAGRLGFVEGEDLAKLTDGYSGIGPALNRLMANWKRY